MARSTNGLAGTRLVHAAAPRTVEPITLACWVRPTALSGTRVWMSIADGTGNNNLFALYCDNAQLAFWKSFVDGTNVRAYAGGVLTTNAWQHACGVAASAASRACYRDGANKGTDATASSAFNPLPNRTGLLYNAGSDQVHVATGAIAEAGIWSVALTDDEVAALAKGVSPRHIRPAALLAYWPVLGNLSPEPDRWRNRYDLTVVGSVPKADHPRVFYGRGGA